MASIALARAACHAVAHGAGPTRRDRPSSSLQRGGGARLRGASVTAAVLGCGSRRCAFRTRCSVSANSRTLFAGSEHLHAALLRRRDTRPRAERTVRTRVFASSAAHADHKVRWGAQRRGSCELSRLTLSSVALRALGSTFMARSMVRLLLLPCARPCEAGIAHSRGAAQRVPPLTVSLPRCARSRLGQCHSACRHSAFAGAGQHELV